MQLLILTLVTTLVKHEIRLSSPAFKEGEHIPVKYTCEGENVNPPLQVSNIPAGTKSLALIVEDPEATRGTFDHWIIWNLPVKETIDENSAPGIQGNNGGGTSAYTGPCPPNGVHHYHFKLFALDQMLDLPEGSTKTRLQEAMKGHVLAETELIGLYKKVKG